MNKKIKRIAVIVSVFLVASALVACGGGVSKKAFSEYVKSVLDANYKGETDKLARLTDSEKEAVKASYNETVEHLADAIIASYGINLSDESKEVKDKYIDFTKRLYAKADYEVKVSEGSDDGCVATVLVRPMKLIGETRSSVDELIASFNTKKNNGEFDDYTIKRYEAEFAEGILSILEAGLENISYGDQTSVEVTMTGSDPTYSMSEEDLRAIDKILLQ